MTYCSHCGASDASFHDEECPRFQDPEACDRDLFDSLLTGSVKPVKSDGGSSSYYFLPKWATELRHVISYKGMSFARGNIFKACYRLGEKDGTDIKYDINKMRLFLDDLEEMYERGERV